MASQSESSHVAMIQESLDRSDSGNTSNTRPAGGDRQPLERRRWEDEDPHHHHGWADRTCREGGYACVFLSKLHWFSLGRPLPSAVTSHSL